MTREEPLRFHIDRRGRILVENVGRAALPLLAALAPGDPVLRALLEQANTVNPAASSAHAMKE